MNENKRADEILNASVSVNRQLAQFGDKLCALTNQTFSKMDALNCVNLITSLRAELIEMNKKIIENYVSEGRKKEYLESNMAFINANYEDNGRYASAIDYRTNEMEQISEENVDREGLPPIL